MSYCEVLYKATLADKVISERQVHGIQDHSEMICEMDTTDYYTIIGFMNGKLISLGINIESALSRFKVQILW